MITTIELLPSGVKSQPLFTAEQYEKFREDWQEQVVPELEEYDRKRARSEHASRSRWVD